MADGASRIMVVDDHHLFRMGLAQLLRRAGFDVVAEAASAEAALRAVVEHRPAVVLMDMNLPGMSGIDATRQVRSTAPDTAVLMVTVVADDAEVNEAMVAGAAGYVLKDAAEEELVAAVRYVADGHAYVSPKVAATLVRRLREAGPTTPRPEDGPELSDRELEVLRLLARGADNADIAAALVISQSTVKHHVSAILRKLGVDNRVQAAVRAHEDGLLSP
jgi:DNA-binding NarL/FixJ family response regulator